MSSRSINGVFRQQVLPGTASLAFNLLDVNTPTGSTSPNRTQGASLIDQIAARPTIGTKWTIAGWAITLNPWILFASTAIYGKMGNLRGGISTVGTPTNGNFFGTPVAFTFPMKPFPSDSFLLADIFAGDQDPAPPTLPPNPTTFPTPSTLSVTSSLPQPVEIGPGDQITIGLWLTPSITTGQWNLGVSDAKWSIFYDLTQG